MNTWQDVLLQSMKPGVEFKIITAGRGVGKSQISEYLQNWYAIFGDEMKFQKLDGPVLVDDKPWYTVTCGYEQAKWLREQDKDQWYEHQGGRRVFDISEPVYLMLGIKFK